MARTKVTRSSKNKRKRISDDDEASGSGSASGDGGQPPAKRTPRSSRQKAQTPKSTRSSRRLRDSNKGKGASNNNEPAAPATPTTTTTTTTATTTATTTTTPTDTTTSAVRPLPVISEPVPTLSALPAGSETWPATALVSAVLLDTPRLTEKTLKGFFPESHNSKPGVKKLYRAYRDHTKVLQTSVREAIDRRYSEFESAPHLRTVNGMSCASVTASLNALCTDYEAQIAAAEANRLRYLATLEKFENALEPIKATSNASLDGVIDNVVALKKTLGV